MTSDLDELPKSRFVYALAACQLPTPFRHATRRCSVGGTVSRFSPNQTIPSNLRAARFRYRSMPSTCFHCSYCFDHLASVRLKISSFSHTELNIAKYCDQNHIIDRFRNGKDLFDRSSEPLRRTYSNETDLPRLLQLQQKRFVCYLIDHHCPMQ